MKTLLFVALVVLIHPLAAHANGNGHGGHWGDMMDFGHGGALMWILLLVLIGVAVYYLVQNTKSKAQEGSKGESPVDILKRRYAEGEITKEEFEEKKRDLVS